MMNASNPITEDGPVPKRRTQKRITPATRKAAITSLLASGMSQTDAATQLGISRKTVTRDVAEAREGLQLADSVLARAQAHIKVAKIEVERRVERYRDIAEQDAQPAAALAALTRLDAIDGLVPEIDRLRARIQDDSRPSQPMFSVVGAVSVTVNANPSQNQSDTAIDVTPKPTDH
jgi:transposase